MDESELVSLLEQYERDGMGYLNSELAASRREAMEYYLAEPFGNEVEGRSQVIDRVVSDTIEGILPPLLDIFTAGDRVVEFEPTGPEDEESAKQASEYINHVFLKDNPGFLILHSMFKDALLQKLGVCKVYWEEKEETESQSVTLPEGIGEDQIAVLEDASRETGWETERDGNVLTVSRQKKVGKCCVEAVPPEEFLFDRRAKDVQSAIYVAHRTRKTASELVELGYDRKQVEELQSDRDEQIEDERNARFSDIDQDYDSNESDQGATRTLWVSEAYVKVDYDDDGIAEMRRIVTSNHQVLKKGGKPDNTVWDGPRPFAAITPTLMPHRLVGLSIADFVKDLQLLKSTIWRQILDNLYLANNARHVVTDQVNLDDLLTSRPGGIVRLKPGVPQTTGQVEPLVTPMIANQAFPMLQYADEIKENRTGFTRYNQGADSNSLNKTATGITQILNMAQQRQKLVAKVFAETGVKDIFKIILYMVTKYQDEARVIRLRNQFVPIDPSEWKNEFDISVNVGLGTGNRDQMLSHLLNLIGLQIQAIQMQGGINGPIITGGNVFETFKKIVTNMGFKTPELFVTDPSTAEPQEPPPDPEMMKLQQEGQLKQIELQQTGQFKGQELALKERETAATLALKEREIMANIELQKLKLGVDVEMQSAKMQSDAHLQKEKMTADTQEKQQQPSIVFDREGKAVNGMMDSTKAEVEAALSSTVMGMAQKEIELKSNIAQVGQAVEQLGQAVAVLAQPREKKITVIRENGKAVGFVVDDGVTIKEGTLERNGNQITGATVTER
jgi:hypothetical protein